MCVLWVKVKSFTFPAVICSTQTSLCFILKSSWSKQLTCFTLKQSLLLCQCLQWILSYTQVRPTLQLNNSTNLPWKSTKASFHSFIHLNITSDDRAGVMFSLTKQVSKQTNNWGQVRFNYIFFLFMKIKYFL